MGEELFYIPSVFKMEPKNIEYGLKEFYDDVRYQLGGSDEMEKAAVVMKEAEEIYEKLKENFDPKKAKAFAYYIDLCAIDLGLYHSFKPGLYMRAVDVEEYLIYKEKWLKRGEFDGLPLDCEETSYTMEDVNKNYNRCLCGMLTMLSEPGSYTDTEIENINDILKDMVKHYMMLSNNFSQELANIFIENTKDLIKRYDLKELGEIER